MVERKLYKTKLCLLYKRGHCPRQSCSFAHGEAELRRFSGSSSGRRDYRGSDLRDKLERRRSPPRRFSPRRDTRGRHAFHGHSPPRSLEKNSDRKRRKTKNLDDHSDYSGSLRISDGSGDQERRQASPDSRYILEEQLQQAQLDMINLEDHKAQLHIYLEERAQEADSLASKILELESQLYKEKEDCKRVTSKIKKFVKAHNRHSRIQDELKRSQARLQKLADQLGSDASRPGGNEDDSSINIVSDGEPTDNHITGARYEMQNNVSPDHKKLQASTEAAEEMETEKVPKERFPVRNMRPEKKSSRWNASHVQTHESKGFEDMDSRAVLPSTSMAAHAVDDYVDVTDVEEKMEVNGTASDIAENGTADEIPRCPLPLPPPPPLPQNAYSQFKGDDQNVDVEGLDETVDVDIV